jgi:mannose-6-phosphate isomerase-like protein (cupin superfamily)
MKVRRVVTGHSPEGKAIVASDMEVDATTVDILPQLEFHRLWGADETPTFPDDGSPRPGPNFYPPLGGFRFLLYTVPPQSVALRDDLNMEAALAELEEKLPGLAGYIEWDSPGMHVTNTIDFEYVISGEIWLELDDGKEVHLKAGDTVIQNGTHHAWRNKGTESCQMVICLIGARRNSKTSSE